MSEDLYIPILTNWNAEKMNENRKIPVGNLRSGQHRSRQPEEGIISSDEVQRAIIFLMILLFGGLLMSYVVNYGIDLENRMTTDGPEIRVESVYVCPIYNPNKTDAWSLSFDITNFNNYTLLCIDDEFVASVFWSTYNRNQSEELTLLAKGGLSQRTCVEPSSHTSVNMTLTAEVPNNSDWGYGTIRFGLKLHGEFAFSYIDTIYYRIGELVCRDAKLAFLTSSSSSSCGAMISDPPLCSYESY